MNIFRSMDISASALTAQRYRMDIIGENIANATVTRTANGEPYRRKYVTFEERNSSFADMYNSYSENYTGASAGVYENSYTNGGVPFSGFGRDGRSLSASTVPGGVRVSGMAEDPSDFKLYYDPEHPDADEDGYVRMPNVDMEHEMVDFISATRSYEANITAINNFKNIAMKALEISRS